MTAAEKEAPKQIIASLARQFYAKGWFPGSGGSLTIRKSPDCIYIAPSGVQKELIEPEDIFIIDRNAEVIERPDNDKLRPSQCTPLFMVAFNGNSQFLMDDII
jgi:ribulose-5-phosphate 4-epimerase/fuculose-1-phosphate aldolase